MIVSDVGLCREGILIDSLLEKIGLFQKDKWAEFARFENEKHKLELKEMKLVHAGEQVEVFKQVMAMNKIPKLMDILFPFKELKHMRVLRNRFNTTMRLVSLAAEDFDEYMKRYLILMEKQSIKTRLGKKKGVQFNPDNITLHQLTNALNNPELCQKNPLYFEASNKFSQFMVAYRSLCEYTDKQ